MSFHAAVLCDRLVVPEYGRVSYSNGLHYNSTASYSCDYCYTIDKSSGDTKRWCQDYGEWTGEAPRCISKLLFQPSSADVVCTLSSVITAPTRIANIPLMLVDSFDQSTFSSMDSLLTLRHVICPSKGLTVPVLTLSYLSCLNHDLWVIFSTVTDRLNGSQ